MKQLCAVVSAAGPLSCKQLQGPYDCLRDGRGQWLCGPGLVTDAAQRSVLASLWAAASHAQREFVVHARVTHRASKPEGKPGTLRVAGVQVETLFPEASTGLAACHVEPLRPSLELAMAPLAAS